jgi:hypothetical protein
VEAVVKVVAVEAGMDNSEAAPQQAEAGAARANSCLEAELFWPLPTRLHYAEADEKYAHSVRILLKAGRLMKIGD